MGWQREEQPDVAANRILDAAEKAFVELGVAATGMGKVAEFAGCSRGTLYRYFSNLHELHLAYIKRTAAAISERVREQLEAIDDPRERLVEGVLAAVREVRATAGAAAWFEPEVSGATARISRASEVIETFAHTSVSGLFVGPRKDPEARMNGRWLVRVILSLLAMPGESDAEERLIVERYATAALIPKASRLAPRKRT